LRGINRAALNHRRNGRDDEILTAYTDTWTRIEEANKAAGWPNDWTVAERDQIEALADDLNPELLIEVSKIPRAAGDAAPVR
jgi:hypothetical protein